MLVPVARVRRVTVALMEVVDVIAVGDGLVATRGTVLVSVLAVRGMRRLALVPVPIVLAVDVTVVEVVPMAVVLDGCVPAVRSMCVGMLSMRATTAHRTLLARGSFRRYRHHQPAPVWNGSVARSGHPPPSPQPSPTPGGDLAQNTE